ncbi:M64 family metallo-endopeptidase [Sphingobacterium sp. UT-1RO-CII-1]|uniref:M64 family metallopeptidase n=1 Tax=Sphingobacterium sp. UT-1RO-CII-1 TaxID=2995225 RepID=UPI00227B2A82|nr:M64 family metallopeptidase [Sphingobacterium sp. UT-1RO-CII-1]MCY4778665.1 M64 family metallo-endopeptidase [Sphingobacterium sp. UT-1RO-CII-1]
MKSIINIIGLIILLFSNGFAQEKQFQVDTLQYQGTDKNVINLVILGDGYTKDELEYFTEDTKRFTHYFFKTEPFAQYANLFNVFAIKTISEESGAIHNSTGDDCPETEYEQTALSPRFNEFPKPIIVPKTNPNTIFGSSFDHYGIHRLVVPQHQEKIREVLKSHTPNYSQVVVLVNSPYYGGSGGEFATATVNIASNDIAIHEIGHSFTNLADEYWAGNMYAVEGPNRTQEADPEKVSWKHWVGTNGIGVYAYGGKGSKANWFRPHEFCKMQYLVAPFCSVCQEAIVETIHSKTNPILNSLPNTDTLTLNKLNDKFVLKLAKPTPNSYKIEWFLNDELIAQNLDSVYINKGSYMEGINSLKAVVRDTTDLIRNPEYLKRLYENNWTINSPNEQELTAPISTWGDTLETCYNGYQALSIKNPQAGVQYTWYDSANSENTIATTNNWVTPKLKADKKYFVEAAFGNKHSKRTAILVKVLPEIKMDYKIKVTKTKNEVILKITDPLDERYNYLWFDANDKQIFNKGVEQSNYLRTDNTNGELIIGADMEITKVYLQKVNKETTCVSEKQEVKIH